LAHEGKKDPDGKPALREVLESLAWHERDKRVGRLSAFPLAILAAVERAGEQIKAGGPRAGELLAALGKSAGRPPEAGSDPKYSAQVGADAKVTGALLRQIGLSAAEAQRLFEKELEDPRVKVARAERWRALGLLAKRIERLGAGASLPPEKYTEALRDIAVAWNSAVAHTRLVQRLCEFCGAPAPLRHVASRTCSTVHASKLHDLKRAPTRKVERATAEHSPKPKAGVTTGHEGDQIHRDHRGPGDHLT
jgi:hypothetical protein